LKRSHAQNSRFANKDKFEGFRIVNFTAFEMHFKAARPSPSTIASVLLHAAVAIIAFCVFSTHQSRCSGPTYAKPFTLVYASASISATQSPVSKSLLTSGKSVTTSNREILSATKPAVATPSTVTAISESSRIENANVGDILPAPAPVPASNSKAEPTAEATVSAGDLAKYAGQIRKLIDEKKEYPESARLSQIEGTVTVRCTLSRSGSLEQSTVASTSGFAVLDYAALNAIRNVETFPAAPSGFQGRELTLAIPISFQLSEE
jgi:TonB family protein